MLSTLMPLSSATHRFGSVTKNDYHPPIAFAGGPLFLGRRNGVHVVLLQLLVHAVRAPGSKPQHDVVVAFLGLAGANTICRGSGGERTTTDMARSFPLRVVRVRSDPVLSSTVQHNVHSNVEAVHPAQVCQARATCCSTGEPTERPGLHSDARVLVSRLGRVVKVVRGVVVEQVVDPRLEAGLDRVPAE